MNIALLNDSFPPLIDGVANTIVNYAQRLNNDTDTATVVVPEYPGADDSGIAFPVERYPAIDATKITGYWAGLPFYPPVEKVLKERKTDLIHSHCPFASTLMARSLREQLDAPLVFTYHTKFDIDIANILSLKLLQEQAIRALVENISACDEIWTVSRGAAENLTSLGYEGDCIVMKNGVDIPKGRLNEQEINKYTEGFNIPHNKPVYLFVGRLMWYKGIKIILDALAALKSQHFDFCAVFVGTGSDELSIKKYVSQINLGDKLIFTGPVHEREILKALYCRADLLLFPSTFDTNGLVVREAAACSLPAVLVSGSCAAEGVEDERTGFFTEENAASLAVCLTKLYNKKPLLMSVGERAASEIYVSWDDAVRDARDRYEIVVDKYRSGQYRKRRKPADDFFMLMGDIIDVVNRIQK